MEKRIQFSIEKPIHQRNFVITIVAKYIVLGIATWFGILILVGFFLRRVIDSFEIFLILISMATFYVYLRYFLRKFSLSDIYDIHIDHEANEIRFKSLGKIRGTELQKSINFSDLKMEFEIQDHSLYGKQRVFMFFEGSKLYNTLNVDTTAWNRLENLDEMIAQLANLGDFDIDSSLQNTQEEVNYR